jgi:hypothetical protein
MDKQLMMHVGGELIIVGGIIFWVNNRFSNVETRVSQLEQNGPPASSKSNNDEQKKQIEELTNRINKLEQVVVSQDQALKYIFSRMPKPPQAPPLPQDVQSELPSVEEESQLGDPAQESVVDPSEDGDAEELKNALQNELDSIQGERELENKQPNNKKKVGRGKYARKK